jgi:hypothetical protein
MVAGASDIDSSSCYSSSSSSDEEENRHKGKRSGKNINGLCFTAQGFCGMAHSSASKKSNKDDSGSDSEEEVNNDPSFLIAENARLNDLLNYHTCFSKENQVQTYMHARIKFHAYSDI